MALICLLVSAAGAIASLQRAIISDSTQDSSLGGRSLTYYGGPVLSTVQVQPVWYGNVQFKTELETFYSAIVKSPWFNVLSQYDVLSGNTSAGVNFGGRLYSALDDANDIQPMLLHMVQSGALKPSNNTYVPIHLQANTSVSVGTFLSCQYFCSYHGVLDISTLGLGVSELYYGVIPDQTGQCASACGVQGFSTVDNLFVVSSYELADATTNPNTLVRGWFDANADATGTVWGEAADICNGQ
ncbi:hypothetical protein HDU83_008072 [Entophlyctis luteolus]|nr:hypothetical protein HDU82_006490 [Entophlyctis luteolus]KAJ3357259.1 hypothetical protein HDU83_008072 [Entophlyctis luteolus]KAJ3394433.1 hypothetical protein HDU84_008429 [Entophlyctis sp. JEL0112]